MLYRWFDESEIGWVNEQYQKIGFKPSQLNADCIAVAMCNQERVGLGRLCQIEGSAFELGGMYIQPGFRGLGIARQLVRFMIKHCNPQDQVYCLPFAHLRNFYLSEGFEELPEELVQTVPHDVLEKHRWCKETYPHDVLLLHFLKTVKHRDHCLEKKESMMQGVINGLMKLLYHLFILLEMTSCVHRKLHFL